MKKLYGKHSFGYEYVDDNLIIRCDREYYRTCKKGTTGYIKKLISGGENYLISPVEPVNLPREVSRFLFVEFNEPVVVEQKEKIYLKFPVEIGVFVEGKSLTVVDIFSLVNPKYALYGSPSEGVVCKYFASNIYSEIPKLNGIEEGIIELEIVNDSDDWVEITKVVFDSYGMKIYYDDFPSMIAKMKIESKNFAETSFIDKPLLRGMQKSVELYSVRRFVERDKFLMEWGF